MQKYLFGPWPISASEIFLTSKYSFGLVNLKPVVPGHVLVIPRRVIPRFCMLTADEVSDMFESVQKVSKVIEREYSATSLSITIQDGPEAGQTVPHVHCHIIPRIAGDWMNNDDIYHEINIRELELGIHAATVGGNADVLESLEIREKKIRGADIERIARTKEEMAQEAARLRILFNHYDDIWNKPKI